ncbi:MAG: toxin-antitoxin system HicB family antitoxin [Desulfobacteria bacterium]
MILKDIVEENVALYEENSKPLPPETAIKEYSGKFLLRPGKEFHKSLAIRALQADESLNNFCLNALKKALFHSNRSNGRLPTSSGTLSDILALWQFHNQTKSEELLTN